jgi:hypothetical protein
MSSNVFAQREFQIFLGGGFHGDSCTLIGSYFEKNVLVIDTLINNEILESGEVVGLAKTLSVKYPKKGRYEIRCKINTNEYMIRFDKICNKTELRIELYYGIDFCILYKGGFLFI